MDQLDSLSTERAQVPTTVFPEIQANPAGLTDARGSRSRRQAPGGPENADDDDAEVGSDDPIEEAAEATIEEGTAGILGPNPRPVLGANEDEARELSEELAESGALDIEVISVTTNEDETIVTETGEVLMVRIDGTSELVETPDGKRVLLLDEMLPSYEATAIAAGTVLAVVTQQAFYLGIRLSTETMMDDLTNVFGKKLLEDVDPEFLVLAILSVNAWNTYAFFDRDPGLEKWRLSEKWE